MYMQRYNKYTENMSKVDMALYIRVDIRLKISQKAPFQKTQCLIQNGRMNCATLDKSSVCSAVFIFLSNCV